jgi:hypothetical protein
MDGSSDPFPELARVTDRGESAHHKLRKITEIGNDGKASTPNRSQQMSYHGVFIRFEKRQWQVARGHSRSAFGVNRSGRFYLIRLRLAQRSRPSGQNELGLYDIPFIPQGSGNTYARSRNDSPQ